MSSNVLIKVTLNEIRCRDTLHQWSKLTDSSSSRVYGATANSEWRAGARGVKDLQLQASAVDRVCDF